VTDYKTWWLCFYSTILMLAKVTKTVLTTIENSEQQTDTLPLIFVRSSSNSHRT